MAGSVNTVTTPVIIQSNADSYSSPRLMVNEPRVMTMIENKLVAPTEIR